MVDFSLTDENRLVQQSVRAFAEAEILPGIRQWDEDGGFPRELFGKMAEQGFASMYGSNFFQGWEKVTATRKPWPPRARNTRRLGSRSRLSAWSRSPLAITPRE
jgi:alkylation response protein AidB-like acyl-CoA dehydrogenase